MRYLHLAIPFTILVLAGCSGSTTHKRGATSDAGADGGVNRKDAGRTDSGGLAGSHAGGAGGAGGKSGAGTGGGGSGGSNAGSDGGIADASIDASAATHDDAGSVPLVDGGTGCVGPGAETVLSATNAGLPSRGLVLWLRGDRGVYKTSANRVCAWVDQSGNGNVLRAAVNPPLWTGTGLGSKAAIHFDAASTYMTVGGVLGIAPKSGRTFVAVVQLVNTTGRCQAVMQGKSGSPGTYLNLDANTFQTAGSREGVYATNNAYDSALATSTSARVHAYTMDTLVPGTAVLSAINYRVNGASQSLTRNSGGLGNGNLEDFSGADFTLVGSAPDAFIAEVLVYDRALSVSERASAEAALKARYGIP